MANSNNWGEIYNSTWWGDKAWSANTLFIDSAPPGFGLNLLKGSEDLDNTIDWDRLPDTTSTPTVSANAVTDPNGGTTAERVDFTANRQARLQQRVTLEASKQYTFSVYAKVDTGTQNFRLRNVTLGDAESKTATTSWTRFSYTFTTTTAGDYDLSLQNNDNTARTLEFWGAMLNEGATAGDYVKTDASFGGSSPTPAYSGFGDSFGKVTAYYSLRQFTEAETLNAIRVRRSSDDTEQDIGFDSNGDLDTTALLAFVGGQNLLVQSNQFDTTWTTQNVTPTNGETGYDGSSDAWLLDISGGTSSQRIEQAMTFGGTQTFSVYAKAGTLNWIRLRGSSNTYFDLENGVIGTDGHIDSKIESIGNGWYRCSVVTATSTLARIYLANSDGNVTQSSGSIYIQDAQLEEGSTATTYNKTTTGIGGDGAVTKWYDQSGNNNDAINADASEQPLVVSGGSVVTENGKAALDFDGVDDSFTANALAGLSRLDLFFAHQTSDSQYVHFAEVSSITDRGFTANSGDSGDGLPANMGTPTMYNNGTQFTGTTRDDVRTAQDGHQIISYIDADTTAFATFEIGGHGSYIFNGKFQELIAFDSDQSGNQSGIETNINDHFDIYTP